MNMTRIYHIACSIIFVFFSYSVISQDKDPSISYILIDGWSSDIFQKLREEGKLPVLDSLARSGISTYNGIISFPSMTGYSFYPFVTGVDAADSGIFGLRWFDRSLDQGNLRNYVGRTNIYMNEDIRTDVKTIYELLPDDSSVTINSFLNRGAQKSVKKGWMLTTAKYGSNQHFGKLRDIPLLGSSISRNLFEHEQIITELAIEQLEDDPRIHWVTYATPDASQHITGLSADYDELIIQIDSLIGTYIHAYKQMGHTSRHLAIISDHGVQDVAYNTNPIRHIQQDLGLKLERGSATELWKGRLDTPLASLQHLDGYFVVNGNLSAYIYMTDPALDFPEKWRSRNYYDQLSAYGSNQIDLIEYLSNLEGVGLVICSVSTSEHLIAHDGHIARLEYASDGYRYSMLSDTDPLGYLDNVHTQRLVNHGFFADSLWQNSSLSTEYPDAFHRLHALMKQPNSPDIVLCADHNYDFGKNYEIFVNNYRGGHGGLHRSMMRVPFILSGPSIHPEVLTMMRSEELGLMILDLMGIQQRAN